MPLEITWGGLKILKPIPYSRTSAVTSRWGLGMEDFEGPCVVWVWSGRWELQSIFLLWISQSRSCMVPSLVESSGMCSWLTLLKATIFSPVGMVRDPFIHGFCELLVELLEGVLWNLADLPNTGRGSHGPSMIALAVRPVPVMRAFDSFLCCGQWALVLGGSTLSLLALGWV